MTEKQAKKLRAARADLYAVAAELDREEITEALATQVRRVADSVPVVATLVKTSPAALTLVAEGEGLEKIG